MFFNVRRKTRSKFNFVNKHMMETKPITSSIITVFLLLSGCTKTVYQEVPVQNKLSADGESTAMTGMLNDGSDPTSTIPDGTTSSTVLTTNNNVAATNQALLNGTTNTGTTVSNTQANQQSTQQIAEQAAQLTAQQIAQQTAELTAQQLADQSAQLSAQQLAQQQTQLTIQQQTQLAAQQQAQLVAQQQAQLAAQQANNALLQTQAEQTAAATTAEINAAIAAAAAVANSSIREPAVKGVPGAVVDCDLLLPCQWVSPNQDFTFTVGDVGNTATLDRLSIKYTISPSYDTSLSLGSGSTTLLPGGENLNLIQQSLGNSNGSRALATLAGQNIVGSATYDREATTTSIAGWTFTVVDNGLPRNVAFINLPVGNANSVAIDCAGALPCQWESGVENVSITLVAVGGYSLNGRLNVNFNVITERATDIILDAGAMAVSANGEMIDGRTHGWGQELGFAEVKTTSGGGFMLPGTVSFYRTPTQPTALRSLSLVIYEDAPTPRWNPQFLNIPAL